MAVPVTVLTSKFEDLVAIGLRHLLEDDPHLELLATDVPPSGIDAAIARYRPTVTMLNFGSLTTPAQVFQLHQTFPETRLVVLANRPTAAECNQMLSFGATACLSKDTQGRDVIHAVHLASRGMHVLPRSAAGGGNLNGARVKGSDLLTPREADVLELLLELSTNAQIAQTLSIGLETVRTHARNIYRKLGVSSRRDLARLAGAEAVRAEDPPAES